MTIITGTIALLGSPIASSGVLDIEGYRREIDWCVQNGATGIMTAPSVGEFTSMSIEERLTLLRIGLEQANKHESGILAIANVSAPSTEEAIYYGKEAASMGYRAIIMAPPWYWHCAMGEVYEHYARVAEATGLALCVYNNPSLTGIIMSPDFLSRLLQIPNVQAVKETVTDISYLNHLFKVLGETPPVLHTHRAYLYSLINGCEGSFMAPFSLRASVECRRAFRSGNWGRASAIQQSMATLLPSMEESSGGLLGMWKYASSVAMGIDLGPPRPPHSFPDERSQSIINERLLYLEAIMASER